MLIWLDPLTPKHANLCSAVAIHLKKKGHDVVITTRHHDITESVLDSYEMKYHSFGKHGGGNLADKLTAGTERILQLTKYITSLEKQPDLFISCIFFDQKSI